MMKIEVGISTFGAPRIHRDEGRGLTILENQRIGSGFHWERSIESLLPGEVELRAVDEEFQLLNRLPVEQYLECVVGSEMNPKAPIEFLKAHAIISRSWVVGKMRRFRKAGRAGDNGGKVRSAEEIVDWEDSDDHQDFDVCADDHCQRYQGLQKITERSLEALKATAGQVLITAGGEIVDARFSKCCGGRTELFSTCWQEEERACLESFEDPWCDLEGMEVVGRRELLGMVMKDYDLLNSGGYRWTERVKKGLISENLRKRFGKEIGMIEGIELEERGPSGRLKRLRLIGSAGEIRIGKELMIRKLLSATHLYSSAFEVEREDEDSYYLKGRGWGHGVGLCQIGAARMGKEGYSAEEILRFYYPGTEIGDISVLVKV